MWNNSKVSIRYTWGKISDCHIIEVGLHEDHGAVRDRRRAGGERQLVVTGAWAGVI